MRRAIGSAPQSVPALKALLRRPMVRRILAACGSNAYAQATSTAMQLLSLPLFLSHWSLATYGHWLVLTAAPACLAMADAGMLTAAGNRMTMLGGEGRPSAANAVFQSAIAFVATVCAVALPLVLAAVLLWPGDVAASWPSRAAIVLLAASVLVSLVGGLPEAVYKATQRYALGAALANTTRLAEWLGSLAGLWWGGDFIAVAAGALAARVLCTAAMIVHAAGTTPDFRWRLDQASLPELRRCAGPAISFMAFPAANALNFQGMTLVAGAVLGPAATVIFNTYRTLARVTVQATAIFSLALWPEFSRLYGQGQRAVLATLYRRSQGLGLLLALAASIVVYLAAPWVLKLWSQGRIEFAAPLMMAAMAYAAAAGAWHVSRVLLLSTNEHGALAWPYLAASLACVPLAWALAQAWGLTGIVAAMGLLELAMLALCRWLSRRMLAPAPRRPGLEAAA